MMRQSQNPKPSATGALPPGAIPVGALDAARAALASADSAAGMGVEDVWGGDAQAGIPTGFSNAPDTGWRRVAWRPLVQRDALLVPSDRVEDRPCPAVLEREIVNGRDRGDLTGRPVYVRYDGQRDGRPRSDGKPPARYHAFSVVPLGTGDSVPF